MKNLEEKKQALRAELEGITTKVSETVSLIKAKDGELIEINTESREGSPFSPNDFADHEGILSIIVGFGQCRCQSGAICERAKEDAPTMFVLSEDDCGISSVFKMDFPDYEKM